MAREASQLNTDCAPALKVAISKIEDQKREIQTLRDKWQQLNDAYMALKGREAKVAPRIEALRAALAKFGRHPTGDLEGVGRCAGFLQAAPFRDDLCNCGLNAALGELGR